MEVSGQFHAAGRFTPRAGGRSTGTHWIWDWVSPSAGLDAVEYIEISFPFGESNPSHPAHRKFQQKDSMKNAVYHPLCLTHTYTQIYNIVGQWKCLANPGIIMDRDKYTNSLLFADDLTVIQNNENKLQKSNSYVLNIFFKILTENNIL
jgi:hypothetical protein